MIANPAVVFAAPGTVSGAVVNSGENADLFNGGIGVGTILNSGATEYVEPGSMISGATLVTAAQLYVDSGATAIDTVVIGGVSGAYGIGVQHQRAERWSTVAAANTCSAAVSRISHDRQQRRL